MSDSNEDAWYTITLATPNLNAFRIRAAYVTVDERLFPGYTQLKTKAGVIAALVRSEMVAVIQRADETAPVAAKPSPPAGPTPAAVPQFRPPAPGPAASLAYTTSSPRS